MSRISFLSFRVPSRMRDRLKGLAADRGRSVQDVMLDLLDGFLTEADPRPPELGSIVARLRSHRGELRKQGVAKLWVFGSVARGEAGVDSDKIGRAHV